MQETLKILLLILPLGVFAQHVPQTTYNTGPDTPSWASLMYENPTAVDEIRAGFEMWREAYPNVKNQHSQFYKRWMRQAQWELQETSEEYISKSREASAQRSGEWTQMGPWYYDPEVAMYFQVQSPGACHAYTVEQSYSNPDVVYAGTATAGMYRSSNKGLNWELISGGLPETSVYSIAIHEADENIVWLGSGGKKLYRSEDGGETWTMCGSGTYQNADRWYRTLLKTELGLFAATDDGLWFSDDLGATMQLIQVGEFMELEQHPTDPMIMYTVRLQGGGTIFQKSTDGGMTFSSAGVGDGWPTLVTDGEQKRTEISVSAAEPDAVFALAAGSTPDGGGLYGYYVSHDSGVTFEQACCGDGPGGPWEVDNNPNILGWSEFGDGDGGQYYYDLALGASPTDAGKQFAAGICVWRTESAGATWSQNAHWVTWAGEFTHDRYTHADVHDVKFFTQQDGTVDMWVASDGGVYYSADEGDNIEPRMYGLHGTDFWGWQAGWRSNNVMVGGTYHNGTLIRNDDLYHWGAESDTSGGWLAELAGDNYRGFVNPGNPSIGYHDGGAFSYSDDRFERISGEAFDNSKNPNTSYWYGEYGNFAWDPTNYNKFYSPVGTELWMTEDGGVSWTLIHDFEGEKIISVKVSPRDPNRIFVSHKQNGSNWKIHRTDDGGQNWQNVSLSNSESDYNSNKAIYLDVDGENPDRVYAVLLGTQDGYQIFNSLDAGDTWQNLTTSTLNDEHVVSLAHQRGTSGGIYLGTTRAVYYRDDSMNDWELYNSGLPLITPATFLQADYCGGAIRAAGSRSVHQSPFYSQSDVQAAFMADHTEINLATPCSPSPVHFSDVSVAKCEGTSYNWEFEGGSPATAEGTDVIVSYIEVGNFDVTLTVIEADGGTDSITWTDLINVTDESVLEAWGIEENFDGNQFPPAHWRMETPGHHWEHAYDLLDETNGVAQFPNYWVSTDGAEDLLITPGFNPSDIEVIQFDYSHVQYSSYIDGLEVWSRVSGEDEWIVLWEAYGADLSIEGGYVWFWYDTEGEASWETISIPVPSYWADTDASCAEIAFVNVGGYGNHTWLDNIIVGSPGSTDDIDSHRSLSIYPNPSEGIFNVKAQDLEMDDFIITDVMGRVVENGTCSDFFRVDLRGQPSGMYVFSVPGVVSYRLVVR